MFDGNQGTFVRTIAKELKRTLTDVDGEKEAPFGTLKSFAELACGPFSSDKQ